MHDVWGNCPCLTCVENYISNACYSEFGTTNGNLGSGTSNNLNSSPIFETSGNIRRSSEASGDVLAGRHALESSKEPPPALFVHAASMVHPSKKRKERATTPVEAAHERIVKRLGKAYDMDHTCKSRAFIQELLEIRKLYKFIPNSEPILTHTSETYDAAQLRPAAAAADQVPPHHSLNRDDAVSTRSSQARNVNYHCTYPNCSSGPWSGRTAKTDWKRHEQSVHWNNQRWMCKECSACRQLTQGVFACNFCQTIFPDLEVAHQHTLGCETARCKGNTFSRKDKLREHLRSHHNVQQITPQQDRWFYEVESGWPRQCGFCGIRFNEWKSRVEHVAEEFSKGAMISSWRIPFIPKPEDRTFGMVGQDPKDDDGDDEDLHHTFQDAMGVVSRSPAHRPTDHDFTTSQNSFQHGGRSRNSAKHDERKQLTHNTGDQSHVSQKHLKRSLAMKPQETPPSTTMFSTYGSQEDEPLDFDKAHKSTSTKNTLWIDNDQPESIFDHHQLQRWAYQTTPDEMTLTERLEKRKWEADCLERL
ncbi:hypothetical protein L207DRAFT_346404 [Hyaloscypha variabilis F]|uniref:C2H2-type domain-containing protein n=1 Tax=Hyaloscypha variabilis (strain UAMH 11265 / GT02V1 / F) TaxID=1149755 RepID=A0A2J6RQN3_HYAVF|nr:hypothetical protein L207DRAFT_346404 [Hyaloscypha variabilis F]